MQLNTNNTELIDGIRNGDERVFKSAFDLHYRELVIAAYQILKDQEISKDAVQEVFVELWKKRNNLSNKIILLPYLKRAVINRSLNILKSRKHHMGAGPDPLDVLLEKQNLPDEVLQGKELSEVIEKTIGLLPDRCRAIFMLCRIQGKSHAEIAAQMDISTKTIENQMNKALKILAKAVKHYNGQPTLITILLMTEWVLDQFQLLS